MSGNTQESVPDAPAQKSVTDWLMQVISRNETSESNGHDAAKNGNGSGLNGHAPARNGHAAAYEDAHTDSVFGKIENGNGSLALVDPPSQPAPALTSAKMDITADDLCGPPVVGPVTRSLLDEISAEDLCWVPKPEPIVVAEPEVVAPAWEEPPFVYVEPHSVPAQAEAANVPQFVHVDPQGVPAQAAASVDESPLVLPETQPSPAPVCAAQEVHSIPEIESPVSSSPAAVEASSLATDPEPEVTPEITRFEPVVPALSTDGTLAEQPTQGLPLAVAAAHPVADVFDVFNIGPTSVAAQVPLAVKHETSSAPTIMPPAEPFPTAAAQMPVSAHPEPEIILPKVEPTPIEAARIEPARIEPTPSVAPEVFATAKIAPEVAAAPVAEVMATPESATRVEAHAAEVLAPAPVQVPAVAAAVHPTLEMPVVAAAPSTSTVEAPPSVSTAATAKADAARIEAPATAATESGAPAAEPKSKTEVQTEVQAEVLAPVTAQVAPAPPEVSGGLAKIDRETPPKRARRGKRERAVTVADICRDWVLQEMMERDPGGALAGAEPEEELEDLPEESGEGAFAQGGVWGEGKGITDGTSESALALNDEGAEVDGDPRNSAVRTLLHMGSMLPWLARESPAADARSKQSIALTQEVRQEVAGMRLVQQEIRSTVHDHSLQLQRVEDQLSRVRETLVDDADETAELVTSVKSTTRTVQVVGISVCALLGFVLVMVMLLFLRAK